MKEFLPPVWEPSNRTESVFQQGKWRMKNTPGVLTALCWRQCGLQNEGRQEPEDADHRMFLRENHKSNGMILEALKTDTEIPLQETRNEGQGATVVKTLMLGKPAPHTEAPHSKSFCVSDPPSF